MTGRLAATGVDVRETYRIRVTAVDAAGNAASDETPASDGG